MFKTNYIRSFIASNHESWFFQQLAKLSGKYLRAYNNQVNWNVATNGEQYALQTAISQFDGDILDVGANEGQWASMALENSQNRIIHCFEIVPSTFAVLQKTLGNNGCVRLNQIGLGKNVDSILVNYYENSSDRTSAISMPDEYKKIQMKLPVITGDDYVNSNNIESISYLKIDVEGMEFDVLHGFANSIKAGIVKCVQFEHGPAHVITRHFLKDFVDFFALHGFTINRIYPSSLVPLTYNFQEDESFVGANFLALRR